MVVSFTSTGAVAESERLRRMVAPVADWDLLALDEMSGCVWMGLVALIGCGIVLWFVDPLLILVLVIAALGVGVWRWRSGRPPVWIEWEDGHLVEATRFLAGKARRWSRTQVSGVTWSPGGKIHLHRRDGGMDVIVWPKITNSVQDAAHFIADGFGVMAGSDHQ